MSLVSTERLLVLIVLHLSATDLSIEQYTLILFCRKTFGEKIRKHFSGIPVIPGFFSCSFLCFIRLRVPPIMPTVVVKVAFDKLMGF